MGGLGEGFGIVLVLGSLYLLAPSSVPQPRGLPPERIPFNIVLSNASSYHHSSFSSQLLLISAKGNSKQEEDIVFNCFCQ